MKITIPGFDGEVPQIASTMLQSSQSQIALNSRIGSGELRCYNEDIAIEALPEEADPKTIYNYRLKDGSTSWLYWNYKTNVVKGPIENDIYSRTYFITESGELRGFDQTLVGSDMTVDTTNSMPLAIPVHAKLATPTISGTGTGDTESRTYAVTYSREWEDGKLDEGVPSDPSDVIDIQPGQTATITGIVPSTDVGITTITLYRSVTGTTGTTFQRLVGFSNDPADVGATPGLTFAGGVFTYEDTTADEDLGEVLISSEWASPPTGLKGLLSLKNGVLVAFKDNTLYYSVPYQPHAWPATQSVTVDWDIVGLGSFGNTVVVCTKAYPIMISITDPALPIVQPISEHAPCASADSIVSAGGSVLFASFSGIMEISSTRPSLATVNLYDDVSWKELNPVSIYGTIHKNKYYAFYTKSDDTSGAIIIDFKNQSAGVVRLDMYTTASFIDPVEDKFYVCYADTNGTQLIFEVDSALTARRFYTWRSKEFVVPRQPANLAAARLTLAENILDLSTRPGSVEHVAIENPINTLAINVAPVAGGLGSKYTGSTQGKYAVTFNLYADGTKVLTKNITSSRSFRLPSGYRATTYEVELVGNVDIAKVELATSMLELQ